MKQPKPFFRKYTQSWYVQFGKKQINLGRDKKAAWEQYHELMASRKTINGTATAASFFEAYLDWLQKHRSPATYRSATHYLSSFVRFIGKRKQLRRITADQVEEWLVGTKWASTTQSDGISHLNRAFAWGLRKGFLQRSPIAELEYKPSRRRREVYTPEEWQKIVACCDQCFLDILEFMAETGCRPIEARRLERKHIDLENEVAILQWSESKTDSVRVIFLTEKAKEICSRLSDREGPIFRNSRGRPWTKDAIKCRFARIKKKTGIDRIIAYAIRHTYATEALKKSVDSVSLAVLMGHRDVSQIARTYQHLAKDFSYLKEQAKKAKASNA